MDRPWGTANERKCGRNSPKHPGGVKPSAGGATEAHMTPTMQTTSGRVVTMTAAFLARQQQTGGVKDPTR